MCPAYSKRDQEIGNEIAKLEEKRSKLRKNRIWRCPACGNKAAIKDLALKIEHYYVPPYSCTGGAYWSQTGVYQIRCAKCDKNIRYWDTACKGWIFINDHRNYFKEYINLYDDKEPSINAPENKGKFNLRFRT
jgi:hypothetical protein